MYRIGSPIRSCRRERRAGRPRQPARRILFTMKVAMITRPNQIHTASGGNRIAISTKAPPNIGTMASSPNPRSNARSPTTERPPGSIGGRSGSALRWLSVRSTKSSGVGRHRLKSAPTRGQSLDVEVHRLVN